MNNNSTSILEFASSIALPNQKTFVTSNALTAQNHYYQTTTIQPQSIIAGDVSRIMTASGISGISGTPMPAVSGLTGLPAFSHSGIRGQVGISGISGFNPLDPLFNGSSTEKLLNERIQKQCEEFAKKHNLLYGGETNTITARGLEKIDRSNLDEYKKSLESLGFIKFQPFDFQKKLFKNFEANNNLLIKSQRQMGISTCLAIYALHYALNNPGSKIIFIVNHRKNIKNIFNLIDLIYKSLTYKSTFNVSVENNDQKVLSFNNKSTIFLEVPAIVQSVYNDVFIPQRYIGYDVVISDNAFDLFNIKSFNEFHNIENKKVIIASSKETYEEKYDDLYNFGEVFYEISNGISIFKPINIRWEMHPDRTDEWAKGQIEKMGVREFVKQFGSYHPPIRVHHIEVGNVDKEDVPSFIAGEMNSVKRVPILNSDHLPIKDFPVLKYDRPIIEDEWDIDKPRTGKRDVGGRNRLKLRETHTASKNETDGYISSASKNRKVCEIVLGDKPIISNMHIEDRDMVIEILKICNSYIELKSKSK